MTLLISWLCGVIPGAIVYYYIGMTTSLKISSCVFFGRVWTYFMYYCLERTTTLISMHRVINMKGRTGTFMILETEMLSVEWKKVIPSILQSSEHYLESWGLGLQSWGLDLPIIQLKLIPISSKEAQITQSVILFVSSLLSSEGGRAMWYLFSLTMLLFRARKR